MDKKLLRSVREYKKQSFLTPVLVAAEVFVEVLIPLLMAKIIDVGIMNGDMAYIIKLGALLVLLAVVALFFGAKAGQLAAVASSGYAKNLRHDIFYKIQDFSFGNIDHFSKCSFLYSDSLVVKYSIYHGKKQIISPPFSRNPFTGQGFPFKLEYDILPTFGFGTKEKERKMKHGSQNQICAQPHRLYAHRELENRFI